jgi:hypothetical protein
MHTKFGSENVNGKDHSEDLSRRWEDNIRMDHRESGWGGVDWIQLAEDRDKWRTLVKKVMNLPFP